MLMNGKEVNHLVINGETFDKSYVGKIAKAITTTMAAQLKSDGSIFNDTSGGTHMIETGKSYLILAKYKDAINVASNADVNSYWTSIGWVSIDDVDLIDEKVMGGVNSPSYLLFIFYCISLLALGVLLPC